MKVSSLLGHTRELLQSVRTSDKPADALADSFFRSHKYLGSHDRRFVAESTYGTLRHLRMCEALLLKALTAYADDMILEDGYLFLIVAYLLCVDCRTPLGVEDVGPALKSGKLKRNLPAILQSFASLDVPDPPDQVERIGVKYSFPDWMVRRFVDQYGAAEAERLCESLNEQAPIAMRVNTLKTTVEECQEFLKREGVETKRTKLSPLGLVVSKRLNVFQLQAFRDGLFEVQDEGSQLLPFLLDPKPTAKVLDACAGAGGKTLEIAALMKNRGEIVATDVHSGRLEELRRRARRAGVSNVRIRQIGDVAELADRYLDYFDVVVIDAPCSGVGTIRRNPGMKWDVTEESVKEISEKQLHILTVSAPLVKPGGIVAYATCTLFREENEDVVIKFIAGHSDFSLDIPPLDSSKFDLRPFLEGGFVKLSPHRDGTDGFFIAVLRRRIS
jgi:16S rRNA (cytosine967-C5)-methyltransferase